MLRIAVVILALCSTAAFAAPKKAKGKPAPAAASSEKADAAKAKELFKWAQKLYKQARYGEAIAKFEEAYALKPHPVIYFNIGRCHEQLGDVGKAMRAYKDYLRLMPDAKDRETVSDAIANLERRLKDQGMAQLMVYTDPANANIEVDGQSLGNSPASVELRAGNHKLIVSAEGFEKVERGFVMQTSRSSEMTINLRPVAAKETPPLVVNAFPPPPPPPPEDVPKKDEPKKLEPTKDTTTKVAVGPEVGKKVTLKKQKGLLFTYVAGGVAVAALGGGIGLGVAANGTAESLRTSVHTREEVASIQSSANGLALGANISYGAAITAAVAAGVLFFVEGGLPSQPSTAPSKTTPTGKAFTFQF